MQFHLLLMGILFLLWKSVQHILYFCVNLQIQVALLQIPILVLFSAVMSNTSNTSILNLFKTNLVENKVESDLFTLIFPKWDVYAVTLSTFILTYIYIEGKSTYFKGAMLLIAYAVIICAFLIVPK